jgi:tRNA(Ile)-lysidine synthase TilS/MesJ
MPTARRRLLQPLWNALDERLRPALARGALLAVSGGPDSRALLEAVARWPHRHEGEIHVAAVDHGTRPESRDEADAVVGRALVLGFSARRLTAAPSALDEAALRAARLAVLVDEARRAGLDALVTAHHAGDLAEGALLGWLGEGGSGAAMPAVGRWAHGGADILVIRPFLSLARSELALARTACAALDPFVDPEARSARARARRGPLARLHGARADVEHRLAEGARRRRDDEEVLTAAAAGLVDDDGAGGAVIRAGPPALLRRALQQALARLVPDSDVRSSAPAVEIAVGLVGRGVRGTVHMRGATAEVSARGAHLTPVRSPGTAAVAVVRAPTHDGSTHEGPVHEEIVHEGTVGPADRRLSAPADMRRLDGAAPASRRPEDRDET